MNLARQSDALARGLKQMEKQPNPNLQHPVVNIQETIGKTVGRRAIRDGFADGMKLQKTGGQLTKAFGIRGIRPGVYRFNSHEEADAWLMNHWVKNAPK